MNEHEQTADPQDRLVDRALHEALGGESPPDLSERILAAAGGRPLATLAPGEQAMSDSRRTTNSKRILWAMFAIAASLFLAVGLIMPAVRSARETAQRSESQIATPSQKTKSTSTGTQFSVEPPLVAPERSLPGIIIDESKETQESLGITHDSWSERKVPGAVNDAYARRQSGTEPEFVEQQSGPEGRLGSSSGRLPGIMTESEEGARLQIEAELRDKVDQYQSILSHLDARNASAELDMLTSELRTKQKELTQKKEQLVELEAAKRLTVQQANSTSAVEDAIQEDLSRDPMLQSFQQEQYAVTQQMAQLQSITNRKNSPEAKRLQQHLATLGQQIQKYRLTKESELRTRFKSQPNDLLAENMSEYTLRRKKLEQDLANIQQQYESKLTELQSKGQTSGTLAVLEVEIQQLQDLLKAQDVRGPGESGDQYTRIYENPFVVANGENAVSTFSIDVDTASYANVRQFLMQSGQLPPPDAVRLEELINYFDYGYSGPTGDVPFAAHVEVAGCPWQPEHRLVRVGIKGREMARTQRPQSNLVFLIDVSGSMDEPAKLPLLVEGMKLLTRELGENDRVAIVVYASSEGLALPSTRGDQQATILAALEQLRAGGSTAGGAGIELAYQTAQDNFIKGGVNRVILCTDGDFNVGVTSTADLERMAEQKAKDTGVFLTVLGFGRGNLNDAMMEVISGKGNGNYHYVDGLTEARKVLVEELSGTLVTIAKDVKLQIEFNPAQVAGYRLLGYENRMLRTEDFNDDKKDAGEIGAGHTVTALYEIVPAGKSVDTPGVDPLKYQQTDKPANEGTASDELLTLKIRYKQPDGDTSTKLEFPITDGGGSFAESTEDFRFAAAVASFGMLLRDSEHRGNTSYAAVLEIAEGAMKRDPHGYRAEFLELVQRARQLTGQ